MLNNHFLLLKSKTRTTHLNDLSSVLRWNTIGITIAGVTNRFGNASNKLSYPKGIYAYIDRSNTLYIADEDNNRIQKYVRDASFGETVVGSATAIDGSMPNLLLGSSELTDRSNNRVQLWYKGASNGTTIAGTGFISFITDYLDNALSQVNYPYGFAYDSIQNAIYVGDTSNHRVMNFRIGVKNDTVIAGNNGPDTNNNQLYGPFGIHVDYVSNSIIIPNFSGHNAVRWMVGGSNWTLIAGTTASLLNYPIVHRLPSCLVSLGVYQGNFKLENFNFTTSENYDFLLGLSYNQPIFCPNASWNPDATTFTSDETIGIFPLDLFITADNTIYVPNRSKQQTIVFSNMYSIPIHNTTLHSNNTISVFVTEDNDIYYSFTWNVTNGIRQLAENLSTDADVSALETCPRCSDIFVDIYCSADSAHRVIRKSLNNESDSMKTVAGIGLLGSTSYMLNSPNEIFVETNLDLYMADCYNDRVQLVALNQFNGITVAGNGSTVPTIALNRPAGVALDQNKYLFIVDRRNFRIVASSQYGFRSSHPISRC